MMVVLQCIKKIYCYRLHWSTLMILLMNLGQLITQIQMPNMLRQKSNRGRLRKRKIKHVKPGEVAVAA